MGETEEKILDCCLGNGYRKCYNLVFWELAEECRSFDNYGNGIEGIANFLKSFDIAIIYRGDKVIVDDFERLFYYTGDISLIAKTLETYVEVMRSIEVYRRTSALFFANVIETSEGLATLRLLEALPVFQRQAPALAKIATVHRYTDPLKLEELAKKYLVEGRCIYGALLTYYLGIKVSRTLADPGKFINLLSESPGMALTLAHEAAIMLSASGPFYPGNVDELERIIGNIDTENQLVTLLRLGYEYLRSARDLGDYMNDGDYNNIKVYIDGSKLFLRLGAHMAGAKVKDSQVKITYSDHDIERARLLSDFLKRLGFNVSEDNGKINILVPLDKISNIAKVLATTTSVDLLGCHEIYEKASNVEELLELRKQCV